MTSNFWNVVWHGRSIGYTGLFENVGFGGFYLRRAGFRCTVANEILPERCRWFSEVHSDAKMICDDFWKPEVRAELARLHREAGNEGMLISMPCQSYTLCNAKRDPTDKRGSLFIPTLDFIKEVQPRWVAMENVGQITRVKSPLSKGKFISQHIIDEMKAMGYQCSAGIQDCADFFTPQHRKRWIALFIKEGEGIWNLPIPSGKIITISRAIGHLSSLEAGESGWEFRHDAPPMSPFQAIVMKHTPVGKSAQDNPHPYKGCKTDGSPSGAKFKCAFQRKNPDDAGNCQVSGSSDPSGMRTVHYGRMLKDGTTSDARCLTIRELLILSGISPWYPIPTWASDRLIRTVIGEIWVPRHILAVMRMLPRKKRK
jgi:DNA (cytosine-5)-methyltransferase 1